jgi:hypothetical protein
VQAAVSGYEEEFGEGIRVAAVDATTPQAKIVVESLGFKNHGLVIQSADGEVLFKQPDHEVKLDEVHAWVAQRLGDAG